MIIAIDIGGTFVKIGLLSDEKIIDQLKLSTNSEQAFSKTMVQVEMAIDQLLINNSFARNSVTGIGMGFPGLVDSSKMKVISTNKKHDDAVNFDFKDWAQKSFKAPLFLENDARIALMGEWQYGAGKGLDNIVMVTFGTGIGTAALIDGKPLVGKHFQAGNLGGHFTVNHKGYECTCGNRGCVEAEASTWNLNALLKSDPRYDNSLIKGKELDFKSLFKYADEGGELCRDVRNHCLEVWAAGIVNQIHAYDPEIVILGGGIMKSAATIVPFINEYVNKYAWTPWGDVQIKQSKIPNRSALLGAYYMVKHNMKNEQ